MGVNYKVMLGNVKVTVAVIVTGVLQDDVVGDGDGNEVEGVEDMLELDVVEDNVLVRQ